MNIAEIYCGNNTWVIGVAYASHLVSTSCNDELFPIDVGDRCLWLWSYLWSRLFVLQSLFSTALHHNRSFICCGIVYCALDINCRQHIQSHLIKLTASHHMGSDHNICDDITAVVITSQQLWSHHNCVHMDQFSNCLDCLLYIRLLLVQPYNIESHHITSHHQHKNCISTNNMMLNLLLMISYIGVNVILQCM